jgi:DNA modification methylase
MNLADLKPDALNANKGTARGRKMLRASLKELGAGRSILVDKNGVIIAGNKTAEAARELGHKNIRVVESTGDELVVVQRTDLEIDSKKGRRLAIADNRIAEVDLEWNPETLATLNLDLGDFFSDVELRKIGMAQDGDEGPAPQLDRAAELEAKWKTERGQIWEIGKHRLMCGDSTAAKDVSSVLKKAVPFLCVTDPPYGVNYDPNWRSVEAAKGNLAYAASRVGEVTNDNRADWRETWALFPGDVIYSWHPAGATSLVHAAALQDSGFALRMQIIWAKSNFPIGRGDYHVRHEPCWYAVREGKPAKRNDDRTQTTLWEINLDKNVEGGHSTQKPLECMARAMRNHDVADVYDPFMGSGTTLVAAEKEKRRCYGMEIEPKYVAVALERMSAMGLKPKLARA